MKVICGDAYREYCGHVLDGGWGREPNMFHPAGFKYNPTGRQDFYFTKVDQYYFAKFVYEILPSIKDPFYLITMDGDLPIWFGWPETQVLLESPYLVRWFSSNVVFLHPKLFSIPIGTSFSYFRELWRIQIPEIASMNLEKTNLVYANYSTGFPEPEIRKECFSETDRLMYPKVSWIHELDSNGKLIGQREYLTQIAKSLFNISPNGCGWDCYRHWESIYLRTIPIVTDDNLNIMFYDDLPFLKIKKWSNFRDLKLSRELYDEIWDGFDINDLDLDRFMERSASKPHPLYKRLKRSDVSHLADGLRDVLSPNSFIDVPPVMAKPDPQPVAIPTAADGKPEIRFISIEMPKESYRPKFLPFVPKELRTVLPKHLWQAHA